jgi:hypothetical protein
MTKRWEELGWGREAGFHAFPSRRPRRQRSFLPRPTLDMTAAQRTFDMAKLFSAFVFRSRPPLGLQFEPVERLASASHICRRDSHGPASNLFKCFPNPRAIFRAAVPELECKLTTRML